MASEETGAKKVEIYDPPMCCPTGVCGPAVDPVLLRVQDAIGALEKDGVEVERYSLSQQLREVMENPLVGELIRSRGKKALPVTVVGGTVLKTGGYPTYEELCAALGIEPRTLPKPLPMAE